MTLSGSHRFFILMPDVDGYQLNILGPQDLVGNDVNKTRINNIDGVGELVDALELSMSDEELLGLKVEWERRNDTYSPKVKSRQDTNKLYYVGKQRGERVVSSNLLFEAEETFIPQALSKNPEPVVWSDNTQEGKDASNDIKTMLQFHADTLCLRKKLGVMVRHWSIYFMGVVKHGWDAKLKDITLDIRKPQNFIVDPDGYIDEYGNYCGEFIGERVKSTAKKLIDLFPKHKAEIIIKCDGKLGTSMTYVEWWTDEYCFSTFEDIVLDKHKNEFFNYGDEEKSDEQGNIIQTATKGKNHFAVPKMPYTFLSVFSLQEHPHDITNLIEQNIANQDDITDRDIQISKNLKHGNNSIAVSGLSFNAETAREAAQALEDGDPVLVPDGRVEDGIKRLPANALPSGLLEAQQFNKDTLRSVFGTQGITPSSDDYKETARGMILSQSQDNTRIGGGIGDALEQVADNIFNWWLQLYFVFYDEEHYGAVMGSGRAVELVALTNMNMNRRFVVSVQAGSMKPKDELSEINEALELWGKQALDPITLFKRINDPDPIETAKRVALWITNPQGYMVQYFPAEAPMQDSANAQNPPDLNPQQPAIDQSLSAEPASAQLSNVPI